MRGSNGIMSALGRGSSWLATACRTSRTAAQGPYRLSPISPSLGSHFSRKLCGMRTGVKRTISSCTPAVRTLPSAAFCSSGASITDRCKTGRSLSRVDRPSGLWRGSGGSDM